MKHDPYIGIVSLLEYMDRKTGRPAKTANKMFKGAKKINFEISELPEIVRRRKEELDGLEKFLKEFNKKEEKKPDKGIKFSGLEWFIIGIISYPIVGPLYNVIRHNLETMGTVIK